MKFFQNFLLLLLSFSLTISAQTEVENLLKKSSEFELKNQLPKAIAEISKAIALKPDDADLYLRRVELNFGLPDYKLVSQDAKKALELKPNDKRIVLTAAQFFRFIRECEEALNALNNFIHNNAETDDVIYSRAHSKMCSGNWFGAYEDVSRALELSPHNSHYRTLKISLLAKIGYKEFSADQFEQFLTALKGDYSKSDPQTGREDIGRQISDVLFARAGAFHGRGEETEEMADLAETVRYYPNDFNYRIRAKVYVDHDLFEKAIEDYTKAIALSPTVEIFPLERADAYVYAGKLNEALKDYDIALKLDSGLKDIIDAKKAWAIERLAKK